MITYLNDILIYSDNLKMHHKHMHKVLIKLNEQAMYVKKSKSRFKIKKIQFLKYVIWSNQIKKNLKKTEAVWDWSTLWKVKEVQVFLELTNYYWKFVSNYAKIVKSLTCLTCKDKRWHWDKKQKNVFCTLKKSLSETAHLQIFNQVCEKILKTDTSDFAVEACLYQIKDGQKKSIVYWFRKLSEFKKRYKIYNKKLLAIVKALQDWRSYLADISKSV